MEAVHTMNHASLVGQSRWSPSFPLLRVLLFTEVLWLLVHGDGQSGGNRRGEVFERGERRLERVREMQENESREQEK